MELKLKEHFEIVEQGTHYKLPCYEVVNSVGIVETGNFIELKFVRGSKLLDEDVERREGTLHEHLLAAMISDLKYKNNLVPSGETSIGITKLQECLHWFRERQINRLKNNVQGTYKK